MYGHNLVAVYVTREDAERAKSKLISADIPATSIRLSSDVPIAPTTHTEPGFFAWLFGEAPEVDRNYYQTQIQRHRTILSVHVTSDPLHMRAVELLEEDPKPLELDDSTDDTSEAALSKVASAAAIGQRHGDVVPPGMIRPPSARPEQVPGASAMPGPAVDEREQVIPVAREELQVGKDVTETHKRIRIYTVERPVEEQVTLHDERVTIERRPATAANLSGEMPQDRTIDVTERHEEAVVDKNRVAEEVVVTREGQDRTETVRGTVREQKVEIEDADDKTKPRGTARTKGS